MDLIQSDPEIPSLTLTTQILASLTRSQTRSQTATLTSDSESDSESEDDFNPFGGSGSDSDDGECRLACVHARASVCVWERQTEKKMYCFVMDLNCIID